MACSEAVVARDACKEKVSALWFARGHLIAVMGDFLMGCAVLLLVGCAGVRSEAPEEEQGHTEATKQQQGHLETTEGQARSAEATSEENRCEGTRTFTLREYHAFQGWIWRGTYTTNDVPGCPKGGLITGTDKRDELDARGCRQRLGHGDKRL